MAKEDQTKKEEKVLTTESQVQEKASNTIQEVRKKDARVYNPNLFQVLFKYDGEYTYAAPKSFTVMLYSDLVETPLPMNLRIQIVTGKGN